MYFAVKFGKWHIQWFPLFALHGFQTENQHPGFVGNTGWCFLKFPGNLWNLREIHPSWNDIRVLLPLGKEDPFPQKLFCIFRPRFYARLLKHTYASDWESAIVRLPFPPSTVNFFAQTFLSHVTSTSKNLFLVRIMPFLIMPHSIFQPA